MNDINNNLNKTLSPYLDLDHLNILSVTNEFVILKTSYRYNIDTERFNTHKSEIYINKEEFLSLMSDWLDKKEEFHKDKDDFYGYGHGSVFFDNVIEKEEGTRKDVRAFICSSAYIDMRLEII